MSTELNVKSLVIYLSGIALAMFFLNYMPWTSLSAFTTTMNPAFQWVYYFAIVIGLLFPLFYSMGEDELAWYCLGLSILVSAIVWMVVQPAQIAAALMTLLLGVFFFITPIVQKRVKNWDLVKNIFHILEGLFIVLATGFYANWILDAFVGYTSYNHVMPQFLFIGGGLTVMFGGILLVYGLFNILTMKTSGVFNNYFGRIAKGFYMLMVVVFLLGILYNEVVYAVAAGVVNPWPQYTPPFPTSIGFFTGLSGLGLTNLGAFLIIMLFVYGMSKIVEKQK